MIIYCKMIFLVVLQLCELVEKMKLLMSMMKVVREHDPLGRDVELFRRHLYVGDKPKLVVKDSTGAELVDGFEIKSHDYKLVKTRFSAFLNTNLHSYLQGIGVNKLVVTGNIVGSIFYYSLSYL